LNDGILLTAHGTVENLAELPAFLARIRHGRPAPPELVKELERRYAAIGGSPLLRVTAEQAKELAAQTGLPVFLGMRLWRPEIADALSAALGEGIQRLCVLPLAPFSVHVYFSAAEQALARLKEAPGAALPAGGKLELVACEPFGQSTGYVAAAADAIAPFLTSETSEALILTAHSLPTRIISAGDPYRDQVEASARAIAGRLGRSYELAYQSQGADGGDWLGPDLRTTLVAAQARGRKRVVIAPIGFLSDHVETLYDLDVEARGWATELGLEFVRVPALNAAPALVSALAEAARRALLG
jgi:ferrochelatase